MLPCSLSGTLLSNFLDSISTHSINKVSPCLRLDNSTRNWEQNQTKHVVLLRYGVICYFVAFWLPQRYNSFYVCACIVSTPIHAHSHTTSVVFFLLSHHLLALLWLSLPPCVNIYVLIRFSLFSCISSFSQGCPTL